MHVVRIAPYVFALSKFLKIFVGIDGREWRLNNRSIVLPSIFIDHASPEAMYRVPGMTAHEIEAKALEVLGVLTAGK
jgi:deoxyxylulose-5-phosphate synthase